MQPATPPVATLTIDLGAIVDNWRFLRAQGSPGTECAAVVKADAYGLGAATVSAALHVGGCRTFFVALVAEALALRPRLPSDSRLFVLHGALPGAEEDCAANELVPVLNSPDQVRRWTRLAAHRGARLPAAVQVDTGMARLGLSPSDLAELTDGDWAGVQPVLLLSHLASAEDHEDPLNALQLRRFEALRLRWPGVPCSLANSSGVFLGPRWHFDILRPGAAIYGVAPTLDCANPMRPVVQLQGRLIQWRSVAAGEGVGYNHKWRAERPSRIATASIGYADGWLRSLSDRATLHLAGHPVPLVGRVSMDTVTLDVTGLPDALLSPGTPVDFIDSEFDINAVAAAAGTNAYEILTSLGPRYARRYINP